MNKKIRVAVFFGGQSTEHDVSIVSGTSVIKNLDKSKYEIIPIYISRESKWYKYVKPLENIEPLYVGEEIDNLEEIDRIENILNNIDIAFPVLHGVGGEDGSIQGLFRMFNVPYVGCNILSSSIGMDKVYAKIIFDRAKINQAKYVYVKRNKDKYTYIDNEFNEKIYSLQDLGRMIEGILEYPMFVKPSNSGSSVGINKAKNIIELLQYIEYASKYDNKILIEQGIVGREVECAVLGEKEVISSCVGEIKTSEEFYSFDSKYKSNESRIIIPADLPKETSNIIRDLAIKAFKAIDGKGLSRVDFFIDEKNDKIYINEINTMPGFTQISMYPKLFENIGISYKELLNQLIEISLEN